MQISRRPANTIQHIHRCKHVPKRRVEIGGDISRTTMFRELEIRVHSPVKRYRRRAIPCIFFNPSAKGMGGEGGVFVQCEKSGCKEQMEKADSGISRLQRRFNQPENIPLERENQVKLIILYEILCTLVDSAFTRTGKYGHKFCSIYKFNPPNV